MSSTQWVREASRCTDVFVGDYIP